MGDDVLLDWRHNVALRRIVVGPLRTNCWAVHPPGERQALLVDPGADAGRVLDAVRDLDIVAVVLTHAHFDHVLALPEITRALDVPVLAHPDDAPVWPHELDHLRRHGHFDAGTSTAELLAADSGSLTPPPDAPLWDGRTQPVLEGLRLRVGSLTATVLHTPGHTPGGLTLALPGHLLTGDTLFPGGPGLTGWPLSDFATIMLSVRRLLGHSPDTAVHPGHGPSTTVGRQRPHLDDWQRRGW
ncbi:MBL fold metallo-hydrolase [Goodfellowiella coeruleoviolacea]|uniref:Glyoxylase, beta-lactamase superfamily II n=1 Tax=Goodfellowiella coeruleoviolacea TaxID=334858 RepID=A0AAE3GK77_9PSEU|nr:MBL fold metallo-hydrolase [Goodfellowiella coeruleoviolacea]MCP2169721.1 Glyoxylase, beta-lactamase superfamily II [Goodfellowiella coeruleoviolacea]